MNGLRSSSPSGRSTSRSRSFVSSSGGSSSGETVSRSMPTAYPTVGRLQVALGLQPGGLQGFLALPKGLEADHLVAPEGPHLEVAELGGGAACGSGRALDHGRDDAVSRLGDLLRVDRDLGPGLEKASHVPRDLFRAKVGPGVGELGAHDEQDQRIEQIGAGAKVALAPALVDTADRVDVLLRHRCAVSRPIRTLAAGYGLASPELTATRWSLTPR